MGEIKHLNAKIKVGQFDDESLFVVPLALVPGNEFILREKGASMSRFWIIFVTAIWWQKVRINIVQIPLKVVALQLFAKFYPVCDVSVRYVFRVRIHLRNWNAGFEFLKIRFI